MKEIRERGLTSDDIGVSGPGAEDPESEESSEVNPKPCVTMLVSAVA